MSKLYRPKIFSQFPEVVAAFSGKDPDKPLQGSIMAREDIPEIQANKAALAKQLGFAPDHLVLPRLEHGDTIVIPNTKGDGSLSPGPADGITTDKPGWLVGVAVADCSAILVYDSANKAVGAIHSGWRGSKLNITKAGVEIMGLTGSKPEDLYVYVGPGACAKCYEVEDDVYQQFDPIYFTKKNEVKWLFDNTAVVRDQLLEAGVKQENIEIDSRCTMEDPELFSARRDKLDTGRNVAVIGLKP